MHANVFNFHIWIPHEKIGDPNFFLIRIFRLYEEQGELL